MNIIILYPAVKNIPIGGLQVIYEYANRLVRDGHNVTILYACYFRELDEGLFRRVKSLAKYIYVQLLRKHQACQWFALDSRIKERYLYEYNDKNLPSADIYIATAVTTAYYLKRLREAVLKKLYLIQGQETFILNDIRQVVDSYRFGFANIAISKWLKDLVETSSKKPCHLVVNGFDRQKYHLTIPIEKKDKYAVSMLYHTREPKDIPTGMKALAIVKAKVPELVVKMFGAYPRPNDLPEWFEYTQCPSPEEHLKINNECAIYMGCSKMEGWGLTVGEAMMCGQAVACTDNKGYLEMAIHDRNALVSKVGNAEALANNIIALIQDDTLRERIARQGVEDINHFDLEESYLKFKQIVES